MTILKNNSFTILLLWAYFDRLKYVLMRLTEFAEFIHVVWTISGHIRCQLKLQINASLIFDQWRSSHVNSGWAAKLPSVPQWWKRGQLIGTAKYISKGTPSLWKVINCARVTFAAHLTSSCNEGIRTFWWPRSAWWVFI